MSKTNTFKAILKRNNSKIQDARATRFAEQAKMDYKSLLDSKKKQLFEYETRLEDMQDISASNITTDANRIKGTTFDSKSFVEERADILIGISMLKEEIRVIEEDGSFYEV